jgi:hypothetical protein
MFIAHNLQLFPGNIDNSLNSFELSDEIIIPSYYLNNIMKNMRDDEMLSMNMINITNGLSYLVAIGAPHTYDKNTIYAPQWILDLIGCTIDNSIIKLEKIDINIIPVATKIIIKPLVPIAFQIDTIACFEKALMNIHSIKEGITIEVNSEELGSDYTIFAHIEKVEPAPISRISAGEVNVEFINDFKSLSSINSDIMPQQEPSLEPNPITSATIIEEVPISPEERRRQVRESWLGLFEKKFPKK